MSHVKTWVDHETVEITETEVVSKRLSLAGLESALVSWQAALDEATAKVSEIKKEIAEIEALPGRPEAIIDPLFVPKEEVVEEVSDVKPE